MAIGAFYSAGQAEDLWTIAEAWVGLHRVSWAPPSAPDGVLLPDRAAVASLKQHLLQVGMGTVGLQFWTPGDIRRHLLAHHHPGASLATREDLQFLAALARPPVEGAGLVTEAPPPDAWLSAWDELAEAGWGNEGFSDDLARNWGERFTTLLGSTGLLVAAPAEWGMAAEPPARPILGKVLILGFSAQHSRHLALLRAVVTQADETVLALPLPSDDPVSEGWWETWEHLAGEATPVPAPARPVGPLEVLINALQQQRPLEQPVPLELVTAGNLSDEAEVIARQVRHWLAEPTCTRVAVVLPSSLGLARLVAQRLQDWEIPHHDTFGFFAAPKLEQRLLDAWVDWQLEPRLDALAGFAELLQQHGSLDAPTSQLLDKAWAEGVTALATDDVAFIRAWLRATERHPAALDWMDAWPQLDETGSWAHLAEQAALSLDRLGWAQAWSELRTKCAGLAAVETPCTRRIFLRWLGERLRTPGRQRQAVGRDAFAKVQLVDYRETTGLRCSHLILGGLSEGGWPQTESDGAFLNDTRRRELNQQRREARRHGTWADEGHLLTGSERRQLARVALTDLWAGVSQQACATCTAHHDRELGEPLQPGELFWELVHATQGQMWDDTTLAAQRRRTAQAWLADALPEAQAGSPELPAPSQAAQARSARLDPETPFGAWAGGFGDPPSPPLRFGARAWEAILAAPAQVWMGEILGLEAPSLWLDRISAPQVRGIWIHRWLEQVMRTPRQLGPIPEDLPARLAALAQRDRDLIELTCQQLGRRSSDFWFSLWHGARRITGHLADQLALLRADQWLACPEYPLPRGSEAVLAGIRLPLNGRVDLLLQRGREQERQYWIIDYKTGRREGLKATDVERGRNLQLMLYALALPGASVPTRLSLLSELTDDPVQLQTSELDALAPLLEGLAAIPETGVIGFPGPRRRAGPMLQETFPLALLPIPEWILRQKWALTHPNLPYPA